MIDDRTEWLEADGLGGFASGTACGVRTRRYHALLLAAMTPPTGRVVLVNGFDAWLETPGRQIPLTTQRYAPGVDHPDGISRMLRFTHEPWPTWELQADNTRIRQELLVQHDTGVAVLTWSILEGDGPVVLHVRPYLSGRDYHSMHHENPVFRFEPDRRGARTGFRPYDGLPAVVFESSGSYEHTPDWYRNFLYVAEAERGLDATEDLAAPGIFSFHLHGRGDIATLSCEASASGTPEGDLPAQEALRRARTIADGERRRRTAFASPLERSADAYLVRRGHGRTLVAGYPWFTDWGRDTFIALRGLFARQPAVVRDILVEWAGLVSEGMLPNRLPDTGDTAEFNSVDASLWYVVAVGELLGRTRDSSVVDEAARRVLERAILEVVAGYSAGTRFGIRMDDDGLLAAGVPGQQLTWMDARVGDWVVTPRIGKPVEVQALWLNALHVAAVINPRCGTWLERGLRSFGERFWCESLGYLADVIDVDHQPGTRDETLRPNQILAVGGLPLRIVDNDRARRIVNSVESALVTPLGLRSLAPSHRGYAPRYEGGPAARDGIYHQGPVWPWLAGPFVDAWLHVRGDSAAARTEARARFLEPLLRHLETAGLGHVSEITDAEAPFAPRGCPFQAWSLGELMRMSARLERQLGGMMPLANASAP